DRLLGDAERALQTRRRYREFQQQREQALFHGTLLTGLDAPAGSRAATRAAQQALTLAGLSTDGAGEPPPTPWLTDPEQAQIRTGCCEVLLVLAEEAAQSPVHQREQALRLLENAARLGGLTQAYHLRRAGVLGLLGRAEEATSEKQRAKQCPPTSAF